MAGSIILEPIKETAGVLEIQSDDEKHLKL